MATSEQRSRPASLDPRDTYPALAVLVREISDQIERYGSVACLPAEAVGNTRNDMYLASEAIRFLMKDKENNLTRGDTGVLNA